MGKISLDYTALGDELCKLCNLYLSVMDRMCAQFDRYGDVNARLTTL